jgi:hypothetical protein
MGCWKIWMGLLSAGRTPKVVWERLVPEWSIYATLRMQVVFQMGYLVLISSHPMSSKLCQHPTKLDYKWSVPLVIAKFVSPVTILFANPHTGVIVKKVHVSQLKPHFSAEGVQMKGIQNKKMYILETDIHVFGLCHWIGKLWKSFSHAWFTHMCQLVTFGELSNNVNTTGTGSMCVVASTVVISYGCPLSF